MIPEIDIWRAATLMLQRYGDKALEESATRADQLEAEGDPEGAATWRWIARAIEQLANTTPPGQVHLRHFLHPFFEANASQTEICSIDNAETF
jgi:hypothetical protein